MEQYKIELLEYCRESKALEFGSFKLKSGNESPYFFNIGHLNKGKFLSKIADAYSKIIIKNKLKIDLLFGPAYKGISLAAITALRLSELDPINYGSIEYAYNRKEKKSHGEKGIVVGGCLKNKNIVIIDDVITAGTAIEESIDIIKNNNGRLIGTIVFLDRQEKFFNNDLTAIDNIQKKHKIVIFSVFKIQEIFLNIKSFLHEDEVLAFEKYFKKNM